MSLTPPPIAAGKAALPVIEGALTRAGAIVSKPVFGRRQTLRYKREIERDGAFYNAEVVEERRAEVPAWMAGAGLVLAGLAALTIAGTVASTAGRLAKREGEA